MGDKDLVPVQRWILRLAARFVKEYSNRLDNDGCNDFELPPYVPPQEMAQMIQQQDGGTEDDAMELLGLNHIVTSALAVALATKAKVQP